MRRSILDVHGLRRVDAGGAVEVWRGRLDGVDVAVKRAAPGPPDPPTLDALEHEAATQSRVSHAHVLPLVAVLADPDPGAPALVARWARGGTLEAALDVPADSEPWTVGQAALMVAAVAAAVAAVHASGAAHGDVAAGNVLLDEAGRPQLADFGSAQPVTAAAMGDDRVALARVARQVLDRAVAGRARSAEALVVEGLLDALAAGDATPLGSWADEVRRAVPVSEGFRPPPRLDADPSPGRRRTVEWGPRPPRPAPVAPDRVARRPARLIAATGLALAVCVAVGLTAVRARPGGHSCPPVGRAHADLLGTGCPQAVTWSGQVLTVAAAPGAGVERFQLGRPGDRLLLGRWACAPLATPALYRPATGEVLVYPSLPGAPGPGRGVAPRRTASGVVAGEPVVVADDRGCDAVVVRAARADLGTRRPRR
jgi:tRNA A-37 threonylcarbamoyl transferase component Bud32